MEPDEEKIQRALEEKVPIRQTVTSEAYRRLFEELQRVPSIQPSPTFSGRVVAEIRRQQAEQVDGPLFTGMGVGLFVSVLMGLLLTIDQQTILMTLRAFEMAKGWLVVGLGCLSVFLMLEYRLESRKTMSRLYGQ